MPKRYNTLTNQWNFHYQRCQLWPLVIQEQKDAFWLLAQQTDLELEFPNLAKSLTQIQSDPQRMVCLSSLLHHHTETESFNEHIVTCVVTSGCDQWSDCGSSEVDCFHAEITDYFFILSKIDNYFVPKY